MKKFVLILIIVFTLIRIFLSLQLQLHPDEAYYWLWSKNLDLSYFDHPPMVAYFIKLTTLFSKKEFFIRLSSIITFVLGIVFIYKLVLKMLNDKKIAYTTLFIFNLFPMLAASFIITPDVPMMFFWIISLYFIWLAIREDKILYWIFSGIFVGLTMLSKYNGVLLLISLFLFLLISKNYKKFLFTIKPYLVVIISIIIFLPVIIWNYNNNWVSFKFQFFHGLPVGSKGDINNVISYFLGQVASMGLFLGIICFILPYLYVFSKLEEKRFLSAFSVIPLTVFGITSYKSLAEMNWPVCAYPSIAILTAIFFVNKRTKLKNIYLSFSSAFSIFLILVLYLQAGFRVIPLEKFNKIWAKTDPTNWFYGWKEFALFLDTQEIDVPIVSTTLQLVSELNYYSTKRREIFYNDKQYSIWIKKDFPQKCLCINYESDVKTPPPDSKIYSKINLMKSFSAIRDNNVIRIYHIYECEK